VIIDLRPGAKLQSEVFEMLKDISYKKIDSFNNLIEEVSFDFKDDIDWWVQQPGSRNTFQSPLYYYFCCLHLINSMLSSGQHIDKIISCSPALNKILKSFRKKYHIKFKIQGPKGKISYFIYFCKNYMKSILLAILLFKRKIFQFRSANQTLEFSNFKKKNNLILIDVFVFPGFLTNDRYYSGLWDSLDEKEKERIFFVPTFVQMKGCNYKKSYEELRKSDRNFLIKEDFLKLSDLIFGILHLFRILSLKPKPVKIFENNFSQLIRENLLSYKGLDNALDGILNYRFSKQLKENSFDISMIINWWEGQPLDKGWNLGFNTFHPKALTKGYLGAVPSKLALHLFPTTIEIKNKVVPSELSVIGKKFVDEMRLYNSKYKIEVGPAFRFGHLWKPQVLKEETQSNFIVLVAGSIFLDESINIVKLTISSIKRINLNEIKFFVKLHPTMNMENFKNQIGVNWAKDINDVKDMDSNVKPNLIISGMSSFSLEAISTGTPALLIESTVGLSFSPIPDSVPKSLWRKCKSTDELLEAINYFKNLSNEEIRNYQQLSANIKKDYFEPVNKESISRLLGLSIN
tara:strand:+ start:68397 stop:70118 length:1722 start_codon:yes stop_codon:yes gene_type:complete